ncbi:hypothetical protein [Streptomyces syringium]
MRETLAGLVRAARGAPETLTGYAPWVGVPLSACAESTARQPA